MVERAARRSGAVDLLQEDSVDNPDEFNLKAMASTHPSSVAGSLSGGRCQLHHVNGAIGAPSAADQ
jgi:hypothetical protein